jgi:hypothetical protein
MLSRMGEGWSFMGFLKRLVRGVFAVFAALWIFLEEWVWDHIAAFMAWVGKLPVFRWIEARIAKLPPYAALVSFVIPWLMLLPAKFLALWLMGTGKVKLGVMAFVIAKIVGTAILARLFALTKPALLTIGWFSIGYHKLTGWRDRIYAYVKSMPTWIALKAWSAKLRNAVKEWFRAHFRARVPRDEPPR